MPRNKKASTYLVYAIVGSLLVRSASAQASFLWRINTTPPSYLFGTIHVPYKMVWDAIPDNAKLAFAESKHVYVEGDMTDNETLRAFADCEMLPKGRNVSEVLSPRAYRQMREYVRWYDDLIEAQRDEEEKGDSREVITNADYAFERMYGDWDRKHPFFLHLRLGRRHDLYPCHACSKDYLDLYISHMARSMGKEVHSIEEPAERCAVRRGIDMKKSALYFELRISDLLHNTTCIKGDVQRAVKFYREGALHGLYDDEMTLARSKRSAADCPKRLQSPIKKLWLKELYRQLDDSLLIRRNEQWVVKMIQLLKQPEGYFFAFGANHFLGKHRVQIALEAAGFTIDHIGPRDSISSSDRAASTLSLSILMLSVRQAIIYHIF